MAITYKASGVDIDAGESMVKQILPLVRSTHSEKVLSDIGLFGGFYDGTFPEMKHPVLVGSTDGVGTKLKIAFMMNKHDTVGSCLVNHCVNDILCCGAKPLFFLDYFASGHLDTKVAVEVVKGFVAACKANNCALIGGETAEMPSIYKDGEYDISGTIVGVVEEDKIINGKRIQVGDVMIGLASSGLHTNGYSLARAALIPKYELDVYMESLGATIGEALLAVHRSYLNEVAPLVEAELLTGISHITGGGLVGNTSRILPKDLTMQIDWNNWQRPPIFDLIQKSGSIEDEEMRRAFNLGIGMVLITRIENAEKVMEAVKIHNPKIIGVITK
ncbi:MAG: phosphoribosylformylglycinamidine cyclo-ligase [Ignavibacteria bacterium]|jgi:phosphoribosylformylglycinamidine cyclo-ligase|nr:phosphoribosylformylglycinamidine cyclo-ligase [Ignavibacteria bacterium]